MFVRRITLGVYLAAGLALAATPALARSHKAPKPSKLERDAMTKARLEAAPCTIEELMDRVEDGTTLLAIEGNFKCKFKDDTCRFSVEAVDTTDGAGVSEFKFDESCEPIPEDFFVPATCTRADALAFARDNVPGVDPGDLTLCKIEQEVEEDGVTMTLQDVWEIKLSIADDPETPDVNEFQSFGLEVQDTGDPANGCALLDDDEDSD